MQDPDPGYAATMRQKAADAGYNVEAYEVTTTRWRVTKDGKPLSDPTGMLRPTGFADETSAWHGAVLAATAR